MPRPTVFAAAVLLALVTAAPSAQQAPASAALDAQVAARLDQHRIPAAVAVVVDRSRVRYRKAFGTSADSIFRIASMTKPVTSVALMQLVEQRRLTLDDPAARYLPELERPALHDGRRAGREITVRHLLTHTSGMGYNFTSPIVRDYRLRDGERYAPLVFEPGERWLYGTSTDWVGRLVERISGQTLEAYFAQHIFTPLGMRDTSYNVAAAKQARVVPIVRRQPDGTFVPVPAPVVPLTEFNGGGGLFSTADDYARFVQMLLNEGELNRTRILSKASVAAMSRNQIGALGVPALKTALPERSADFAFVADGRDKWGLGFLIASADLPGKRAAGSLSWGGINNTHFWVDPARGIGGIILMQFLPFADPTALDVLDAFERGAYRLN